MQAFPGGIGLRAQRELILHGPEQQEVLGSGRSVYDASPTLWCKCLSLFSLASGLMVARGGTVAD
jgi:hypothetical protein